MMKLIINDTSFAPAELTGEWVSLGGGRFHVIHNHKSYAATVVSLNREDKQAVVRVNGALYTVKVEDPFDQLLKEMGMENLLTVKVNEVKAPMPGKVVRVIAQAGDEVKKGDDLLVLEAMKMENVLQSPTDGVVSEIAVKAGDTVEKNALLVVF
jgi:biotin carboxyl carrier protein